MNIFLDTSDIVQIKKWLPVISGVTTNPSILEKQGGDLAMIADLIYPLPISIEACGDFTTDALRYSKEIPNAVIKIPLLTTRGGNNIHIISKLSSEGIQINCTALMSLSQVILADKAGSRYVSLFAGRVDDEGGDYLAMIGDCVDYLSSSHAELIIGSVRTVGNVMDSVNAGAHIITIPPPILEKMVYNERSKATVIEFEEAHSRVSKRSEANSWQYRG